MGDSEHNWPDFHKIPWTEGKFKNLNATADAAQKLWNRL
jgi:hypothetical protein